MIVRDHFSSFTNAKFIKSENNKDLKQGIIDLTVPLKISTNITVKVDNATGFKPLLKNKDPDLAKLNISVVNTDPFNKNENSIVDRGCQELEHEIKTLEPDGRQISLTTLLQAVDIVNKKIRRNGKLSAYDIHFNRNINTGESLDLDYKEIKEQQRKMRDYHNKRHNDKIQHTSESPCAEPGDIVVTREKNDKHKAREIFLVTDNDTEYTTVQKILHPQSNPTTNLRSKQYKTQSKRIEVIRQFGNTCKKKIVQNCNSQWNPIRKYDDSDDETIETQKKPQPIRSCSTPINEPVVVMDDETPLIYQKLNQWEQNQRTEAAKQLENLSESHQGELSSNDSHEILPGNVDKEMSKRELQKQRAKDRIRNIITGENLPQIDGCITDSNPSSATNSPENIPNKKRHSTDPLFLENDETKSLDWDNYMDEEAFDQFDSYLSDRDPDDDFDSYLSNIDCTRVQDVGHILDRINHPLNLSLDSKQNIQIGI